MKLKLRLAFLSLFFAFAASFAFADVATEGEHDVRVELINGKDFKGFKFYIKYQSYTYNMGYQPSGVSNEYLEPGKHVATGARGDASYLYAEGPKGDYKSEVEIGGAFIDHTEGLSYALDRIKITKVDKRSKKISIEVVERQLIDGDGKVISTVKKGAVVGNGWMMMLIPALCLGGLIAYFLVSRRRKAVA